MAIKPPTLPNAPAPIDVGGFIGQYGKSATATAPAPLPAVPSTPGAMVSAPKVDTSKPIDASKLSNNKVNYPAVSPQTSAQTSLSTNLAAIAEQAMKIQTDLKDLQTAPAPKSNGLQDALKGILSLNEQLGTKGQRTLDIQNEERVFEKKKLATKLENEIISKTRAYDKQIEARRKNAQGSFGGAAEQDMLNIERQKNSELADLAIQYKIANDDYVGAFEIAEAKVKAEFEPLQQQIEGLKTYYQLAQNDMSESEKLEAQAAIQAKEAELNFNREKELTKYKAEIEQSSPLYKAQVSNLYSQIEDRRLSRSTTAGNPNGTLSGKPQNATQAQVNGYADRLSEANRVLATLGDKFSSLASVGGILPSFAQTADRQQFEQAKRNFVNAVLRRESGAVISPSEFLNADRQYFAQPGDSSEVLQQKAANRETVINNFYREANVARPVGVGDVVEYGGVKYEVIDEEGNLQQL